MNSTAPEACTPIPHGPVDVRSPAVQLNSSHADQSKKAPLPARQPPIVR
jgi:hypothetical protein